MFLPTSPSPPSGITRRTSPSMPLGGDEEAKPAQAVAHTRELVGGRRDEREPAAADLLPDQIEGGLDRDRVRRDLQELVDGRELAVELAGPLEVALTDSAHLVCDLRADEVRVDADAAHASQLE